MGQEEEIKKREEIYNKYGLKNTKIGKKCDIYLNNIKLNENMILFVCSHEFHVGCILKWLDNHDGCPMCIRIKEN